EIEEVKGGAVCGRYYRFVPFLSPTSSLHSPSYFLSLHTSQCDVVLIFHFHSSSSSQFTLRFSPILIILPILRFYDSAPRSDPRFVSQGSSKSNTKHENDLNASFCDLRRFR
ncbi:hypothetical protein V8G54_024091, partial [Vigna mungo]